MEHQRLYEAVIPARGSLYDSQCAQSSATSCGVRAVQALVVSRFQRLPAHAVQLLMGPWLPS
jgi:hypothetical protein